ncbi:hypothetical protein [Spirochaeta dissipatitropha]
MGYRINYEDNIFFINSQIKTLQKGLNLEIDPEYFRDKLIDDIFFIDACVVRLFQSLEDNPHLISRNQHLKDLQHTISMFCDFINGILQDKFRFAGQLQNARIKLQACLSDQQSRYDKIRSLIQSEQNLDEKEDTISQDELRHLLKIHHEDE